MVWKWFKLILYCLLLFDSRVLSGLLRQLEVHVFLNKGPYFQGMDKKIFPSFLSSQSVSSSIAFHSYKSLRFNQSHKMLVSVHDILLWSLTFPCSHLTSNISVRIVLLLDRSRRGRTDEATAEDEEERGNTWRRDERSLTAGEKRSHFTSHCPFVSLHATQMLHRQIRSIAFSLFWVFRLALQHLPLETALNYRENRLTNCGLKRNIPCFTRNFISARFAVFTFFPL